eukprot:PhF_6_TR31736/c0_g1_i2/m.46712
MSYCATEPSVTLEMLKSAPDNRVHVVTVNSRRYVTILYIPRDGSVRCVDSACYHAGGPLGLGRVEEVDGDPCLLCPSHGYCISLVSGTRIHRDMDIEDGVIICKGVHRTTDLVQRIHRIRVNSDTNHLEVLVDTVTTKYQSDWIAASEKGSACMNIHRRQSLANTTASKVSPPRVSIPAPQADRTSPSPHTSAQQKVTPPVQKVRRCGASPPRSSSMQSP